MEGFTAVFAPRIAAHSEPCSTSRSGWPLIGTCGRSGRHQRSSPVRAEPDVAPGMRCCAAAVQGPSPPGADCSWRSRAVEGGPVKPVPAVPETPSTKPLTVAPTSKGQSRFKGQRHQQGEQEPEERSACGPRRSHHVDERLGLAVLVREQPVVRLAVPP